MKEKRQHPRFQVSQMIAMSMGREEYFNASGINLSLGGMMCETMRELEPHTRVYLMFDIFSGSGEEEPYQVKTEGITLHHSELKNGRYAVGIEFTDLSDTDREHIKMFLGRKDVKPA